MLQASKVIGISTIARRSKLTMRRTGRSWQEIGSAVVSVGWMRIVPSVIWRVSIAPDPKLAWWSENDCGRWNLARSFSFDSHWRIGSDFGFDDRACAVWIWFDGDRWHSRRSLSWSCDRLRDSDLWYKRSSLSRSCDRLRASDLWHKRSSLSGLTWRGLCGAWMCRFVWIRCQRFSFLRTPGRVVTFAMRSLTRCVCACSCCRWYFSCIQSRSQGIRRRCSVWIRIDVSAAPDYLRQSCCHVSCFQVLIDFQDVSNANLTRLRFCRGTGFRFALIVQTNLHDNLVLELVR